MEFRGNSHWPFEAQRKNILLCDFVNLNYGDKDIADLMWALGLIAVYFAALSKTMSNTPV
jgi:hypothetical protein